MESGEWNIRSSCEIEFYGWGSMEFTSRRAINLWKDKLSEYDLPDLTDTSDTLHYILDQFNPFFLVCNSDGQHLYKFDFNEDTFVSIAPIRRWDSGIKDRNLPNGFKWMCWIAFEDCVIILWEAGILRVDVTPVVRPRWQYQHLLDDFFQGNDSNLIYYENENEVWTYRVDDGTRTVVQERPL